MAQYPEAIIIFGKTGSGKGTQAHQLADKLEYEMFSTGDQFRRLRKQDTPLGRRVKEEYDAGKWMPAWFASYFLMDALLRIDEKKGLVFESAGRKLEEAQLFHEMMDWMGKRYAVVHLDIDDETAIERVKSRNRNDNLSDEESTRKRLHEYQEHTIPALTFFREQGTAISINGEQPVDEIHREILNRLASYGSDS
jgi:adenylate kinase